MITYRFPLPDGNSLQVTEWGRAGSDVTVVLTHGLSLSSQAWEDVAAVLVTANPGLRVLAYDHRGHGESSTSQASLEVLAADLAAVLDDLVPSGTVVLGGHSLGGMTIMALAERDPQFVRARVAGVAFVATSAGDVLGPLRRRPGFERAMPWLLRIAARVRFPTRPLFLARLSTRGGLFGTDPRRLDMDRAIRQGAQADSAVVTQLAGSILQHDRFASLRTFDAAEVVVLAGSRDTLTPPRDARAIGAHLPHARVEVYPGAGHYLPYERKEFVAAHLLALADSARQAELEATG